METSKKQYLDHAKVFGLWHVTNIAANAGLEHKNGNK